MNEIISRYEGTKTPGGLAIRVDRHPGEVVLWYLYQGVFDGVPGRHHIGLAQVVKNADVYSVGWLRDREERPYKTRSYWEVARIFESIDSILAGH